MKNLSSYKISWKRVSLAVLICVFIFLLGCLIYYYFAIYQPKQEEIKVYNQLIEIEKQLYEKKGILLPKN